MYLISPKTAHRFVGYLEEEAVITYTGLIREMDEGGLPYWNERKATDGAIKYWGLSKNAKLRDVIIAIRADEIHHREFNHHFSDIPADVNVEGHEFYFLRGEPIKWEEDLEKSTEDFKVYDIKKLKMDSTQSPNRIIQQVVYGGKVIYDCENQKNANDADENKTNEDSSAKS